MIFIDLIAVDVALREEFEYASEVTDHPIESGADVTDNVRARPVGYTIEGVISNTPIEPMATLRRAIGGSRTPVDDVHRGFVQLWRLREPIDISGTTAGDFDDMVMVSYSRSDGPGDGDSLHFTAQFRHVDIVENQRTTINVATPRARKKVNRGSKLAAPTPTTPKEPDWIIQTRDYRGPLGDPGDVI